MKYIVLVLSLILIIGCTPKDAPKNAPDPLETTILSEVPAEGLTMEELAKHDGEESCWLLIEGKVYDVTEFIGKHPGGPAMLDGCGIDSTDLYETRPMGSGTPHSERARDSLAQYYIGDIR